MFLQPTRSECLYHPTMPLDTLYYLQADRGFARSRLCTKEDGTTNNLVLYTVWNCTSKKGENTD
jgi:hypothetical protein